MKNGYKKAGLTLGILGCGLTIMAAVMPAKKEEPKNKSLYYQVIDMKDGKLTTYDTLVNNSEKYTPEDYLATLGIPESENLEIIYLDKVESEISASDQNVHLITVNSEDEEGGETKRIEKNVVNTIELSGDDVSEEEIEKILQEMNMDSIMENVEIEIHRVSAEMDEVDSIMENIEIIIDSISKGTKEISALKMDALDTSEATFYHQSTNENGSLEVMVFGENEGEDFTVVIVSEKPIQPNQMKSSTNQNVNFAINHIYPNPATNEATLTLNFEESGKAIVEIHDLNGNVVLKNKLGKVRGEVTEKIDVSDWAAGMYLIHVEQNGEEVIEKLMVTE